jgi:pimeloyl-ACP methyl ester carboxylesterase
MTTLDTVISADGTSIACERTGAGAPLVLVEPCGHYRGHSAFDGLRSRLAARYTVHSYDRRGRGASEDAAAYAPEREVEDLAALIAAAGSPVFVYGYSSGALLALLAAARQLPIARLALLEPPIQEPGAGPDPLTTELAALVAQGRFSDVVEHFHRSIGVPDEHIAQLRGTPAFAKMTAIAPTFVYDCRISDAITPAQLASVQIPTLVLDSAGSTDDLTGSAASAARMLPRAVHRSLPGQWHKPDDETLAAAVMEFFTGEAGG